MHSKRVIQFSSAVHLTGYRHSFTEDHFRISCSRRGSVKLFFNHTVQISVLRRIAHQFIYDDTFYLVLQPLSCAYTCTLYSVRCARTYRVFYYSHRMVAFYFSDPLPSFAPLTHLRLYNTDIIQFNIPSYHTYTYYVASTP